MNSGLVVAQKGFIYLKENGWRKMSGIWLCTKKPRLNFDSSVLCDLSKQELLQLSADPHTFWAAKKSLQFFFPQNRLFQWGYKPWGLSHSSVFSGFIKRSCRSGKLLCAPDSCRKDHSPWICSADPSRACSSAEVGQYFSSNMNLGIKRDLSRHHWSCGKAAILMAHNCVLF